MREMLTDQTGPRLDAIERRLANIEGILGEHGSAIITVAKEVDEFFEHKFVTFSDEDSPDPVIRLEMSYEMNRVLDKLHTVVADEG